MNDEQIAQWGRDVIVIVITAKSTRQRRTAGLHHICRDPSQRPICGIQIEWIDVPDVLDAKDFDIEHHEYALCKRCERIFRQVIRVYTHEETHHNSGMFHCKHCLKWLWYPQDIGRTCRGPKRRHLKLAPNPVGV